MNGCGHGSSEVTLSKAQRCDDHLGQRRVWRHVLYANSCQSTIFDEISKELLAEIEAKAKSK